jgi:hypothetical protein
VIRSLIEDGAVAYENGQVRLRDRLQAAVIPATVEEVVMSRVDRLDEPTRHVFTAAASGAHSKTTSGEISATSATSTPSCDLGTDS